MLGYDILIIAKVFLENIYHFLNEKGLEHVNGSFMHMVYLLIEKEEFLVRSNLLKYTSSSSKKDNNRKPYKKRMILQSMQLNHLAKMNLNIIN